MAIKREQFDSGNRPTIEFNGKTYKYDYDVTLNDGDSITKEGNGFRIRSRHNSKHGSFTTEISHTDAMLGQPQSDDLEQGNAWGMYIHQPD